MSHSGQSTKRRTVHELDCPEEPPTVRVYVVVCIGLTDTPPCVGTGPVPESVNVRVRVMFGTVRWPATDTSPKPVKDARVALKDAQLMTDEPPEATSEGWAETQHEGCGYVGLCWTGGGGRGAGACWPGSICWSILPIPGNAFTYHGWFACCAAL